MEDCLEDVECGAEVLLRGKEGLREHREVSLQA